MELSRSPAGFSELHFSQHCGDRRQSQSQESQDTSVIKSQAPTSITVLEEQRR